MNIHICRDKQSMTRAMKNAPAGLTNDDTDSIVRGCSTNSCMNLSSLQPNNELFTDIQTDLQVFRVQNKFRLYTLHTRQHLSKLRANAVTTGNETVAADLANRKQDS
jgi:hypothetical protein